MQKTKQELTTQATVIKNETQTGANDETRIGQMYQDIIDSSINTKDDKASQADALAGTNDTKFMTPAMTAYAVTALSPVNTVQPETQAYVARIQLAGSAISTQEIFAYDSFVTEGKLKGWWSAVKFFAPMLGIDLTAALVKAVKPLNDPSSMLATNMLPEHYQANVGITVTDNGNGGRKINTGFIGSANGISKSSVLMGMFVPNAYVLNNNSGFTVGNAGDNGNTDFLMGDLGIGPDSYQSGNQVGGLRVQTVCIAPNETHTYYNGVLSNAVSYADILPINSGSPISNSSATYNTPATIFVCRRGGTEYLSNGTIGGLIFTTAITKDQHRSLNYAWLRMYQSIGRFPNTGGIMGFMGDSITAGQGATAPSKRFSFIVAQKAGCVEVNFGSPGSAIRENNRYSPFPISGYERYSEIFLQRFNTVVMIYGTNDRRSDNTTNGDPSIIADFKAKLLVMARDIVRRGIRLIIGSIPWSSESNTTKQLAYVEAALEVAEEVGATFVDCFNPFLDTGNPAAYSVDGVHLKDNGNDLVATRLLAGFNYRIYRDNSFTFPTVAAGGSESLTLVMYGSKAGMGVDLGITSPVQGIIFSAFVSANNIVTVTATNTTGSSINIPVQTIRVIVTLN